MSIPGQNEMMRPILEYLVEASEAVHLSVLRDHMAEKFGVTRQEREKRLASGNKCFANRVAWSLSNLKATGLLEAPRRGHFEITQIGRDELRDSTTEISHKYLKQKYHDVWLSKTSRTPEEAGQEAEEIGAEIDDEEDDITPDEEIENALQQINDALVEVLLERTREIGHRRFEQLVIDLLLAMKYGASGMRTGGAGDGGIDGVINEDELGFMQIGIQAKCYAEDNKVGAAELREFHGALVGKGFKKGVFVTSSSFTHEALQTVQRANKCIITIDGIQLARLMLKHNFGCKKEPLFRSTIDENFWSEGEEVL